MTLRKPRPWPLAPLLALTAVSGNELVRTFHLSGTGYRRARTEGLTDEQADRWAVHYGYHPAEVWPDWCEAAAS